MNMRTYARAASLLIVLFLAGCASAASGSGNRNRDVITREEIASVEVNNLYDVIQRLRPRWLDVRAQRSFSLDTQIVVYQGQTMLGGPDILRQFDPSAAMWLQYLDGATASASLPGLGSRSVEGAIVIHTTARES